MIIVKGEFPIKAQCREQAVALVRALADAARAEDGCLSYEVYLPIDHADVIVVWQQWRSVTALETHFESDHLDAFLDAIPDLIAGDVTSVRFDVRDMDGDIDDNEVPCSPVMFGDEVTLH